MLYCFPHTYGDELFMSICARYQERMQYPSHTRMMEELFDFSFRSCPIDFPAHLNHLISALPPGHNLTADQMINAHSLYPYYAPFLQSARATRLRDDMKTGEGLGKVRRLIVGRRISVSVSECLRYCPCCVEDDRTRLEECYWHRLHQLPGVEVCPVHEVWLESSDIPAWDPRGSHGIATAECVIASTPPRPLSVHEPGRDSLLGLARNAAWLLQHPQPASALHTRADRYRFLLAERGWGTYRKRFDWAPFWRAFLRVHPLTILQRLDGHARSLRTGRGIRVLLRSHDWAMPPLYHLLLIHFLGMTVEEFLALPSQGDWFGTGPWPCLNPVAPHVHECAVVQCEVRARRQDGRPIGTFSCGCGFVYRRVGPDWGPLARYSYHTVEEYGLYWDWMLRKLWRDRRLTREQLAERLGVSRVTVWEQAGRLGLFAPTSVPRAAKRWARLPAAQQAVLQRKRTRWRRLAQRRKRTVAQERERRRLYAWLFRWDGAWLRDQRVSCRQQGTRRDWAPRLDWPLRDRQVADAITRTAMQLRQDQAPPQWISRARLITVSDHGRWILPYGDRLPKTRQAIVAAVESRQAFQARRQGWKIQQTAPVRGVRDSTTDSTSRSLLDRTHGAPALVGQGSWFEGEDGLW